MSMKHYFSIILTTAIIMHFASAQQEFATFQDTTNKFTVAYPSTWRVQPKNPGYVVIFYADSGKNMNNYHSNVSITLYDTAGRHSTLEGHRERILKFIDAFTDSLVIDQTEGTTMGGIPGHLLVYRGVQFSKQLKYLKGFVLNNGKVYHVTYTATLSEYDKYSDAAMKMIQSFAFITAPKIKK